MSGLPLRQGCSKAHYQVCFCWGCVSVCAEDSRVTLGPLHWNRCLGSPFAGKTSLIFYQPPLGCHKAGTEFMGKSLLSLPTSSSPPS